jgi:RNA ligase (TIGR02306 family)
MNNMENNNSVCYVARINEIKPIPGADNIEQAIVGGWNCIIQKGQYTEGGLVVVATTDAVIPVELSDVMNVTNYLRKGGRVRTVKLRGVYSECLIIPLMYVPKGNINTYTEGKDMMEVMSIFKYEPPVRTISLGGGRKIRYQDNPNFHIYYKFPNLKNVDGMFTKDDIVEITRKIHGTNARYGIVKRSKVTLFHKLRKLFGNKWAEYEYVYGSHNVEKGSDSQGFYDTDVWAKVAEDYNIKNKLWNWVKTHVGNPNELGEGIILYGEIYGAGIQKGYDYGLTNMKFVGFDIKLNGEYMSTYDVYVGLDRLELPHVEELYIGQWNQEVQDSFVFNNYIKGTKVPHEGIVIKHISGNRSKVAKVINPDYLIYGEKHDIGDSH